MNKLLTLSLLFTSLTTNAALFTCPDPKTSSLKWGEPPSPWIVNPFSMNKPQGDETTQFTRANIMVAGIGRGVICTYTNTMGEYSIWWSVPVKVPSRQDSQWIDTNGGFVCSGLPENCQFSAL
ncbi:MAG: DUF3757 domain-containing protein [Tatlockia sp.]|jgi:hypothetical protein